MTSYSRVHQKDEVLLRDLASHLSDVCTSIATFLADLGEVDERKLYVPAAYDSMHAYCVHKLHISEYTAFRRIAVARTARQFPAILPALADGRVNLTAVLLLTPHLTVETATELLAAATHRTKNEIRLLLAERYPQPDVPTLLTPLAPAAVDELGVRAADAPELQLAPERVVPSAGADSVMPTGPLLARTKVVPLSHGKFAVQFTMDDEMHEDLLTVRALLGHVLPSGDVKEVFRRAVHELRVKLEKRKFGKCANPRPQRVAAKGRLVPAAVRRAVLERDGGQCTFVSEQGRRCESRTRLEYDHVEPVARGGESTRDNLRLRCRTHNRYEAELVYGSELMAGKREQGRKRAARVRAVAQVEAIAAAKANAEAKAHAAAEVASQQEVIPWLRALGCSTECARRAAARCEGMVDAPLERRVFVACQGLAPGSAQRAVPMTRSPA